MTRKHGAGELRTGTARIMVAVDRSPASSAAVRAAGQIASALEARVSVLHVRPTGTHEDGPGAPERVAQLELESAGVKAEIAVHGGDPVDEIVAAARSLPADLLVMGSRGRSTLGELLLGSVSQEVVSRVGCPVLLVREDAQARRPPRTILLAVEGPEGSDPLVAITIRLAGGLKAMVTVVHVSYPGGEELERSIYHARQTHGEQAVALAVARLRASGIHATAMPLTARSGLSRALAACADSIDADMIVMGAHSPERADEGAHAELSTAVVHRTRRPVLVTRERTTKP